jgi:hypothetical protein
MHNVFAPGILLMMRRWCYSSKLLQASDHADGLQVQNVSGEWINVPPRPYTFVINIGKGTQRHTVPWTSDFPLPRSLLFPFHSILFSSLVCVLERMTSGVLLTLRPATSWCVHIGLEKVTQGLARATSHRVLAPAAGTSPRYSIPFFQNLAQDVRLSEHVLQRTFSLRVSFPQKNFACFSTLCCWTVPPEVLKLKGRCDGELGQTECE